MAVRDTGKVDRGLQSCALRKSNVWFLAVFSAQTLSDDHAAAITVTSMHGQKYQCSYINKLEQEENEKIKIDEALETGVVELLKPMSEGPCLQYVSKLYIYILI